MGQSTFSGPVVSKAGFKAGTNGTTLSQITKGAIAVTVSTLAAAGEEDLDITITGAAVGDVIIVNPLEAAAEAGVSVSAVWISAADTLTIRVSNQSGSELTGSTANWNYTLIKS